MAQARHARAVHSFICELLAIVMPDLVRGSEYIKNGAEFCECIENAIKEATTPTATETDYIRAIVGTSCREMAAVCNLLKAASALAGLERIAAEYLDANKFRAMLLRKDSRKLERLVAIVRAREGKPVKVLMEIAAELNGRTEGYDGMDAAAKRKAAADVKNVIAKVDEIRGVIDAHKSEIVERVDAVGRKVDSLKSKGRRRGRYSESQRKVCVVCWSKAKGSAELRYSANGRVTYEMAFAYSRRELSVVGIDNVKKFRAVLHSVRNMECEDRRRALEAKQDAARRREKSAVQNKPKNGIIHAMKTKAHSAFALALAIAGGLAAPLRSDASPDILRGGGCSPQSCVAALYARPSALPEPARAEVRGRVVKVADGDTLTILDAANAQHKIRLYGIDAPESRQAFGQKSKQHLSSLVFGKDVRVTYRSRDKYGRILGTIYVDGLDVNLEMIRAGLAWHYKRYDKNPAYAAAESEARSAKRGLWSDPNPTPPEQFRHGSVGSRVPRDRSPIATTGGSRPVATASRTEYRAGSALPVSSRTAAPVNDTWPDTGYWLSTNSNKRHNRKCENYRKTRGYPCSSSDGTPCGKCGG